MLICSVPGTSERFIYTQALSEQINETGHAACITEQREISSPLLSGDCRSGRPSACSIPFHARNGRLPSCADRGAKAAGDLLPSEAIYSHISFPPSLSLLSFPPFFSMKQDYANYVFEFFLFNNVVGGT